MAIVGLPDKAVSEARERVRSALIASGLALPARRITVNLAPADLPKEGSHYDLPIALGLMAALAASGMTRRRIPTRQSPDHPRLPPSGNCAILRSNESFDGQRIVMNPAGKISAFLMLLTAAISIGNREVRAQIQPQQAQQNPTASVLSQIQAGNEECKRKYPDPIKQAIATATCENRNMELLRPQMVYPDLMDQELANNLMLAEKVQKGKMTLIEMKAVKAQLHSQIVTEFQRRQLAKMAATAPPRPGAPAVNPTGFVDRPAPVVQASPEPHCQTARFGMMLGMSCN